MKNKQYKIIKESKDYFFNGEKISLVNREWEVLTLLSKNIIKHPNPRNLSRELTPIHGNGEHPSANVVRTYIKQLRQKLSDIAPDTEFISGSISTGYILQNLQVIDKSKIAKLKVSEFKNKTYKIELTEEQYKKLINAAKRKGIEIENLLEDFIKLIS